MIGERLFIDGVLVPIENTLNPSLNKSIKNIQDISKTKSDFTKTIKLPRSKEADELFGHSFNFNIDDLVFDASVKVDCRYEVGVWIINIPDRACECKVVFHSKDRLTNSEVFNHIWSVRIGCLPVLVIPFGINSFINLLSFHYFCFSGSYCILSGTSLSGYVIERQCSSSKSIGTK